MPAKSWIHYLFPAALAGGACYLPRFIDEETEVQGIWVIQQVIGPSEESGSLIMTLDPAHPFLSVPSTLTLTIIIAVKCASASSGSDEEPEAEHVLLRWGGFNNRVKVY